MEAQKSTVRPTSRVVFIDQARALAISLMLFGHSADRFLAEPWRSGTFWTNYQFFRGVSSAMFLFIAGFSFAVASFRHYQQYTHFSSKLWRRIRRIGLILFLGYLLQLYGPTLTSSISMYSPERWERLVRFDVLQNIGFGLLWLHLIVFFSRKIDNFPLLAGGSLLVFFGLGVWTYQLPVDRQIPVALASALNLYHQSRFPVVPFTGYLIAGSLFGYGYFRLRAAGREHLVFRWAVIVAALLIGFDLATRGSGLFFPYSTVAERMPGYTFARLGVAMGFVVLLFHVERYRKILPRISFLMSSESLAIYFVHLFLVYGSQTIPGALSSYAEKMNPIALGTWVASLWCAMLCLAYVITLLRRGADSPRRMAKHSMIATILAAFVILEKLEPIPVALVIVLSTVIVVLAHQLWRRPAWRRAFFLK